MATSNPGSAKEPIPMLAVVLSAIFMLAMLILLLWFLQPTSVGYSSSPYVTNPTAITVAP